MNKVKVKEEIKMEKKLEFKEYMEETQGLTIDEHSIIDVQVKRLHEYKRQQMNALYAIYKYLDIKAGNKPSTPITMIFGAKAAPAYVIAKDIIHLMRGQIYLSQKKKNLAKQDFEKAMSLGVPQADLRGLLQQCK